MPERQAKTMAVTRLGWDIFDSGSDPRLANFPWVTGKVRGGDHFVVLDYIAARWNAEVEPIIKAHSWGYAKRDVRAAAGIPSEHSAAIALDFNAPDNPLGVDIDKILTPAQIKAIRQIIKDVRGAARWGGEWSRPDAMHVELMGGNALVKQVADLIRAGKLPAPGKVGDVAPAKAPAKTPAKTPAKAPAKAKAWPAGKLLIDGDLGAVTVTALQRLLAGHPTASVRYRGEVDGKFGKLTKASAQRWLAWLGKYSGRIDGDFGALSVRALQAFLVAKGELPNSAYADGNWGDVTTKALQRYINSQASAYNK